MNTIGLSDFPVRIQRSFVEYDRVVLQKGLVTLFGENKTFDDCLKKGKTSFPLGTRRMRRGQEWEKTPTGWRLVKRDRKETSKEKPEKEEHKRVKKPKLHKFDFSKISDEDLKRFAKNTDEEELARFIDHPGKSANGTPIRNIVKEELGKKAVQKQQVKEIQEHAVSDFHKNKKQKKPKLSEPKDSANVRSGTMEISMYLIDKEDIKRAKPLNVKGIGLLV